MGAGVSFENVFLAELRGRGFGAEEYTRTFKKRPHISKSKIDAYSNCTYLKANDFIARDNYKETDQKYIAATQIAYDTLMSLYDVNTRSIAAARFMDFTADMRAMFEKFIKSSRRPNFELRIIGMQSDQAVDSLYGISDFITKNRLGLFEANLFGKEFRHIAIDIYSGMSYSVLLMDRIYKPGELANNMTMEQFWRSLTQRS